MAMGMKCANCGKGIMIGHRMSHAKNRTRRIFKPNLHKSRILVGGMYKTMRLCTKCLRLFKGKSKNPKTQEMKKQEVSSSAPVAAGIV